MSVAVYSRLVELATLSDTHRQDLKTRRGFTDEAIDKWRFRSCGPAMRESIQKLKETFQPSELVESGVVTEALEPARQLTTDNVLIPYLEGDRVLFIRPHKMGLPDKGSQIYKAGTADEIVLAESEFKALASLQLGVPAWGIPGIASFSRLNAPRLLTALKEAGVKLVNIIFDNEVKGDPKHGNYKADPEKRYDTQFYAVVMAQMMEREQVAARICTLPDAWMRDGKIDIDGALAQGRTMDEYRRVIVTGQHQKEYRYRHGKEAIRVLAKKLKAWWRNPLVRVEHGAYWASRKNGKEIVDVSISNFTIQVEANLHIEREGGHVEVVRRVNLVDEFGGTSKKVTISAADMQDGFAEWARGHGNFLWKGNKGELDDIWEGQFMEDSGRVIHQPDHIGKLDNGIYLFGNVAVKDDTTYSHDADETFWIDGAGYKPTSLGDVEPPHIETKTTLDVREYCDRLAHSFGTQSVKAAVGLILGSAFADEIADAVGFYPILFIGGRKGSGKTTLSQWLMAMAGREEKVQNIGKGTTLNSIAQRFRWASNLPCFFDEYRNGRDVEDRESFFRSVYNRGGISKALRHGDGIRSVSVRGTAMIAGEDVPRDPALFSRLVEVRVREDARDSTHFGWLRSQVPTLSNAYYQTIIHKKTILPKIIDGVEKFFSLLKAHGLDDRTAKNYAVSASCYWAICVKEDDAPFRMWLGTAGLSKSQETMEDSISDKFWESVVVYVDRGDIDKEWFKRADGEIVVYFTGVYEKWAEIQKRIGRDSWSDKTIIRVMSDDGSLKEKSAGRRVGGRYRRCVVINEDKAPECLTHLFEEEMNGKPRQPEPVSDHASAAAGERVEPAETAERAEPATDQPRAEDNGPTVGAAQA